MTNFALKTDFKDPIEITDALDTLGAFWVR